MVSGSFAGRGPIIVRLRRQTPGEAILQPPADAFYSILVGSHKDQRPCHVRTVKPKLIIDFLQANALQAMRLCGRGLQKHDPGSVLRDKNSVDVLEADRWDQHVVLVGQLG